MTLCTAAAVVRNSFCSAFSLCVCTIRSPQESLQFTPLYYSKAVWVSRDLESLSMQGGSDLHMLSNCSLHLIVRRSAVVVQTAGEGGTEGPPPSYSRSMSLLTLSVSLFACTKTTNTGGRRARVQSPEASADARRRRWPRKGGDLRKGNRNQGSKAETR